jgi:hypothetical protein
MEVPRARLQVWSPFVLRSVITARSKQQCVHRARPHPTCAQRNACDCNGPWWPGVSVVKNIFTPKGTDPDLKRKQCWDRKSSQKNKIYKAHEKPVSLTSKRNATLVTLCWHFPPITLEGWKPDDMLRWEVGGSRLGGWELGLASLGDKTIWHYLSKWHRSFYGGALGYNSKRWETEMEAIFLHGMPFSTFYLLSGYINYSKHTVFKFRKKFREWERL